MNLYSLLPDTLDTQHAKEQSQSQSQVLRCSLLTAG